MQLVQQILVFENVVGGSSDHFRDLVRGGHLLGDVVHHVLHSIGVHSHMPAFKCGRTLLHRLDALHHCCLALQRQHLLLERHACP